MRGRSCRQREECCGGRCREPPSQLRGQRLRLLLGGVSETGLGGCSRAMTRCFGKALPRQSTRRHLVLAAPPADMLTEAETSVGVQALWPARRGRHRQTCCSLTRCPTPLLHDLCARSGVKGFQRRPRTTPSQGFVSAPLLCAAVMHSPPRDLADHA